LSVGCRENELGVLIRLRNRLSDGVAIVRLARG